MTIGDEAIVFASPGKDCKYIVEERNINREVVAPFFKLGGNMAYNKTHYPIYPYLADKMYAAPKGVQTFFWLLLSKRNQKTNIAIIKASTESEAKKITRDYKAAHAMELVVRVSRQHYMINPAVVQPDYGHYDAVYCEWCKHMDITYGSATECTQHKV